jgi:hypothetical protein
VLPDVKITDGYPLLSTKFGLSEMALLIGVKNFSPLTGRAILALGLSDGLCGLG